METGNRLIFFDGAIVGRRSEQQDSKTNVKLADGCHLCVLADGMGGQAGGQVASQTVCRAFRQYFSANPGAGAQPREALWQALGLANQALTEVITKSPEMEGLGTTVIALVIHEDSGRFSFISVGDSPLYHWRDGFLLRLNDNHAYYEELKRQVATGRLTAAEAESHPKRHAITSALTGRAISLIDQKEGLLRPGEFLVLASDGLQTLDDRPDGQIAKILGGEADDEQKFAQLLKKVEEAGDPHQDNATVIMLGLTPDAPDQVTTNGSGRPGASSGLLKRMALALLAIALLAAAGSWLYFYSRPPEAVQTSGPPDASPPPGEDAQAEVSVEGGPEAAPDGPAAPKEGAVPGPSEKPADLEGEPGQGNPPPADEGRAPKSKDKSKN